MKEADAVAGPPPDSGGQLAQQVFRLRRRRSWQSSGLVAAVLALSVPGVAWLLLEPGSRQVQPVARQGQLQQELKQLQDQVDALRVELDTALAVLRELQAARSDPLAEVQRQVERAAFIMVFQADRMYRQLRLPASAVDSYRRVIALFPDTHWAQVARQRLSEIELDNGDKS